MANPKIPQKLFASIDEDDLFVVLHWDQVTEDIDDAATVITSYKLFRTTKSNLKDAELIGTITTQDINNKVDTIFIDNDADLTLNNYYQVTAVNVDGESELSDVGFDLIKVEFL